MKVSELKTIIRTIIREELKMALGGLLKEVKSNKKPPQPKKYEKKDFSKNSVLNSVLNETAAAEEWKTMGGGTYDSSRASEVLSSTYGKMMNDDSGDANAMVASMGSDPNQVPDDIKNALTRDYSGLMKAIDEKKATR
tara:strand:+ start:40 stop:453 length:414 start_codon:yes stop_codon:yes gene_type:complete